MSPRTPRRPSDDEDTIATTIYLPPEVHKALKVEAAEHGTTMSKIILEALETRTQMLPRSPG